MDLFSRSWTALRAAVAELPDDAYARPSGCTGWLVRDLVCHLVIDAQDVLITLVTPADSEPTVDAVTYWKLVDPPTGEDPLDALIPRLAAAYEDPRLLAFHLDDVGSAAGRAAELADPSVRVSTQGEVLTVRDYLSAYVLEWTLHHLDLLAHLPPGPPEPPAECLAAARALLERIAGRPFPPSFTDTDALLIGTGRRTPTQEETAALRDLAAELPFVLG
ncbi:maleylpyruvate isomerase N-terminal domain-containing protein [Spirillospora sp. NPDC052242]